MNLLLLTVVLLLAVSLLLWSPPLWQWHRGLAVAGIGLELTAIVCLTLTEPSLWLSLFVSLSLYKLINYARLIRDRIQVDFLRRSSLRSTLLLSVAQVVLCSAAAADSRPDITMSSLVYGLVSLQLLLAMVVMSSTSRHLRTTKTLQATTAYTDRQLPSLSVLIPARNETDELQACLTALIASDYPKLEVIVLDDCSQTRRTSEIIRSFAHDGVRFIAGEVPSESWLAKNFAYQQLADTANGEYLMFSGVDLRVTPGALRELITTMLEKQKTMLSVLPQNARPQSWRSLLIQPMRYAWELSLPRRFFNRPPVLSTCWIIKHQTLLDSGGFKATSRSILPESYFARATMRHDDYSFLRSNMLVSNKPVAEQQATAVRMRYPQLHRRLELVWALTLVECIGFVLPLPLAVTLFITGHLLPASLALLSAGLNYAVLLQVTGVMYGRPMFLVGFWQPLYDIMLLNYSLYRYEFSDVVWKDRNICLPVMRWESAIRPSTANPE